MMHVCKICGYETNRRFNLLRHQTTRDKCKNEDEDAVVTNGKIQDGQNTYVVGQNIHAPLKCSKCSKVLKSKKRLKEHEAQCDGFDKKQCNICLKVFSSTKGKYQHQKNVQCTPPLGDSPIDRINMNKPINFSETRITTELVQELLQYDGSLYDFYTQVPSSDDIISNYLNIYNQVKTSRNIVSIDRKASNSITNWCYIILSYKCGISSDLYVEQEIDEKIFDNKDDYDKDVANFIEAAQTKFIKATMIKINDFSSKHVKKQKGQYILT